MKKGCTPPNIFFNVQKYHKQKNKAGCTATPVACGWAGAIFEVTIPFGLEQQGQKIRIIKKVKCDQQTDRSTNNVGCRVANHTTNNPLTFFVTNKHTN